MRLRIIGIGAGDPAHVTAQAAEAMRSVDAFVILDKPGAAHDLTTARTAVLDTVLGAGNHHTIIVPDPPRDRETAAYTGAVDAWRSARVEALAAAFREHIAPDGTVGLLVWGDPSLYDGSTDLGHALAAHPDLDLDFDVIPGVSSVHALTAAHRIGLNRVARPVLITTGRLLAQGWPEGVDDVVVMLDAHLQGRHFPDTFMYWGAYLGSPHQLLAHGPTAEIGEAVWDLRTAARAQHGWIMDTYLLRRNVVLAAPGQPG